MRDHDETRGVRVRAAAIGRAQDLAGAAARRLAGQVPDRGDVPGWVLVTLMTAGLVSVLWFVAGDLLVTVFQNAVSTVLPAAP
jgi:hypothetical protein